ncbi:MAG TPA: flagellar hook-associated protein FlgK [Mycobacteriales bacterium]|nr:flagellar hook-associated protein FlgK [Mycobacteriales bacterium]
MGFQALSIGASALEAMQTAVETVSHNVANAATPGYTRQVTQLAPAYPTNGVPGAIGGGVTAISITRARDALADVTWRSEAATAGAASARSTVLNDAQSAIGALSGPGSLSGDLSSFLSSWNALSLNPSDTAARSVVLQDARQLADDVNSASAQLATLGDDVRTQVSATVDQVNQLATQAANLNKQIVAARNAGQNPNDLQDQRDNVLDQLSQLTGATLHANQDGSVDVFLGTESLVRGVTTVPLVATANGATLGVGFTGGATATIGGSLGGYVSAANSDLPSFSAQLDNFASSVISALNAAQGAGFDLTGAAGQPLFTGTTAATMQVSGAITASGIAASATGAANDGNNALAVAALASTPPVPGGQTLNSQIAGLIGTIGSSAGGATATATAASTALQSATAARSARDGVDVNQESVDLLQYQQAYSAAAQVIATANSMLDTLINKMGA